MESTVCAACIVLARPQAPPVAGASDLLLVRSDREFGHCNFTMAEQVAAVNDLATWVTTGVKPAH